MATRPADAKTRALKEHGCLNPHAETVRDELFLSNAFFDPRDLLQVRYEMLRRVREDGVPVSHAAASFGVSRPHLVPGAACLRGGRAAGPAARPARTATAAQAQRRGGRGVAGGEERTAGADRRRLGRARARTLRHLGPSPQHRPRPRSGKKTPMMRHRSCAAFPAAEHSAYGHGYERMRRHAVEPGVVHDRHGLAVVALRGVAAWLHAFAELPAPPTTVCGDACPEPLPDGVERPVIDILLAMLKGHMEGELA